GVPDKPSFTEGLRVQQLLEAAQLSHESGSWVPLKAGGRRQEAEGRKDKSLCRKFFPIPDSQFPIPK
ncbi:MAG: hypothetical protein F6J86_11545, partial [Symploca sp. SIO1B1]|nr:hypothetical protein [Symploca sp. SIO1B1]